jgi:hypothetical protein
LALGASAGRNDGCWLAELEVMKAMVASKNDPPRHRNRFSTKARA